MMRWIPCHFLLFICLVGVLMPCRAHALCSPVDRKELVKHAFEVYVLRLLPHARLDTRDGRGEAARINSFAHALGFKAADALDLPADLEINVIDAENGKRLHLGVAEIEFGSTSGPARVVGRSGYAGGKIHAYYVASTYNRNVFMVYSETPKDKAVSAFLAQARAIVEDSCGLLATHPFRDESR